ncbi:MAG: CRISPR-associated endonuclease Cas2 [Acidobacteriota bacterium]
MTLSKALRSPVRLWVVSYDVFDDRRRNALARLLEEWGERVQYSVFECRLNPSQMSYLRRKTGGILELSRDQVRWYPVCLRCCARVSKLGSGQTQAGESAPFLIS